MEPRKFKLIKEYPASLKLGSIAERIALKSNSNLLMYFVENYGHLTIEQVENYPEFWEEVIDTGFSVANMHPEVINFIQYFSKILTTSTGRKFYYLPFWFEKIKGSEYKEYHLDKLPDELKEVVNHFRNGE